jgi:hypothetical protein
MLEKQKDIDAAIMSIKITFGLKVTANFIASSPVDVHFM